MNKNSKNGNKLFEFFKKLDRSFFIDNEYKEFANYDNALPIGHEQTISQPSLVYEMTSKLDINKNLKVLEIGTGSGYQTTLLAEFSEKVYTVEKIDALSIKAQERLAKLGYDNVEFKIGDGCEGWVEFAPYDRIIVTAAAGSLPLPLVEQLKPGGKMIIPIGKMGLQVLYLIKKDDKGNIEEEPIEEVVFVELKGKYGWGSDQREHYK